MAIITYCQQSGSHGCCQQPDEDEDDHAFNGKLQIMSWKEFD